MCSGVLVALLQAGRWRRKVAVGSGRETGSTEPSSSLLLALTDPLQKREERPMKPYSFLFFSRWHDRGGTILPLPPLSRCLYVHSGKSGIASVCVLVIRWRVLRHPCVVRPRETSRPKICSSFTFKFISVFILKKLFWNTNKSFHRKKYLWIR